MPADHSWFGIVTALAGPFATICAAGAAVFVTNRLGRRQIAIAESQANTAAAQRDIAYDKLKHDLFGERYKIYVTAKELIKHICQSSFDRETDIEEFRESFIKLDEARFFFPENERLLFARIARLVNDHETARYLHRMSTDDDAFRALRGEEAAKAISQLADIYARLPELMEKELGFSQLTTHA
jgi:hypothetical protein